LAGLEGQTIVSAVHECRVDYEQIKHADIGMPVSSDVFSAGGHMWRVNFYPCGEDESDQAKYQCLYILFELVSASSGGVNAMFEAFLLHRDGQPRHVAAGTSSVDHLQSGLHLFHSHDHRLFREWDWEHKILRTDLEREYLTDGHLTFICVVMVVRDRSIPVPASDIGNHFGSLLDSSDGTDVSFVIGTETFHAHRAVLAARSPVFKAELLGPMAESSMSSITLHDIAPTTFRAMLRFVYTDAFPGADELGDSPSEMVQHLLAAVDRFALDRLKLMCAQKSWEGVSVDTVAGILACAEMYNCLELKDKFIDFFASEENFKKAVLTKGFVQLGQEFPSIIDELRQRIGL
jgi:speckle-type POZ protein